MDIKTLHIGDKKVSEIVSEEILIRDSQDVLDIVGEVWGTEYIMLYEYNFEKDFFDLSTRKLGDVLQNEVFL